MKTIYVLAFIFVLNFSALSQAHSPEESATDPLASMAALLPPPAAAQHPQASGAAPMSLDQIEAEAMANNPEIRAAMRRTVIAEARKGSAGTLEDPMLMYRGWGVPLSRPWDYNQAQNMFMYSQALPGPGKRPLQKLLASADIDIAQVQVEAVRRDVTARVRKAYYDLLRNSDELRIHDEQGALAKQGLESARIKYTVGRVPQQDVLKAQIALTKLVEHLIMLEQDGSMARASLNSLMGRDPSAPLQVAGEYVPPAKLPSLLDLESLAMKSRPELLAVVLAQKKDETQTALARKAYTPDFIISGGYGLMPGGNGMSRNTYMGEFSMTLPWMNRKKHDAEISETVAMSGADKAELDARRTEVFQEIQEALIKAQTSQKLVALYRDTLRPQAQATLKAAAAAYQNDRTDFLNLLESQNTTLDVESSYFRALSEYEQRIAELERAVGSPIARDQEVQTQHGGNEDAGGRKADSTEAPAFKPSAPAASVVVGVNNKQTNTSMEAK